MLGASTLGGLDRRVLQAALLMSMGGRLGKRLVGLFPVTVVGTPGPYKRAASEWVSMSSWRDQDLDGSRRPL